MHLTRKQCAGVPGTVWTNHGLLPKLSFMLPWNSIERLRDHFGDYVIVITCRLCRHTRGNHSGLSCAPLRKRDEPLARMVPRLRCGCGGKSVDVQVGFNRKPRGWSKNPS